MGPAWQKGGESGGIDPEDLAELLRRNMRGKLRLIDGDDQEIMPGIRVFVGARHTFASQYVRVEGNAPFFDRKFRLARTYYLCVCKGIRIIL